MSKNLFSRDGVACCGFLYMSHIMPEADPPLAENHTKIHKIIIVFSLAVKDHSLTELKLIVFRHGMVRDDPVVSTKLLLFFREIL